MALTVAAMDGASSWAGTMKDSMGGRRTVILRRTPSPCADAARRHGWALGIARTGCPSALHKPGPRINPPRRDERIAEAVRRPCGAGMSIAPHRAETTTQKMLP